MKLSESKFVEMSGAQCPSLLSGRNLSQNFFRPLFSGINDTYLPLFVVKMGGVSGLCRDAKSHPKSQINCYLTLNYNSNKQFYTTSSQTALQSIKYSRN